MAVGSGDVCRASVQGLFGSVTRIDNVWHIRNDGGSVAEADALDDIVSVLEALYALIGAILQTAWVIQNIRVINVTDDTDVGDGQFVDNTPGTSGLATFPPQNAYGMAFSTARLRVRGRKFFGPALEGMAVDTGVLHATAISALADVGDFVTTLQVEANSNWRLGVIASSDGVFLPFLSYSISPTIVTQRRRRVGVGI